MTSTRNREETEAPKVFAHLDGYPPEPGENLQQYLARISPMLDTKVRRAEASSNSAWRFIWGLLVLATIISVLTYFKG